MTLPALLDDETFVATPPLATGPRNPATLGFPPMLPVELALAEHPVAEICEAYGLNREQFAAMCANAAFKQAYKTAKESLQKEGMSFRIKARMQSEALLEASWDLIHSAHTQSTVKADLIKATWRVAGFEPKADDRSPVIPIQINVNL